MKFLNKKQNYDTFSRGSRACSPNTQHPQHQHSILRFYDCVEGKKCCEGKQNSLLKKPQHKSSRCCQQNERFERLSTHFDIWKRNKLSAWFGLFCAARAVISSFVCYSCTVLVRQNFKFSPLTRLRGKSLKLSTHNFYNKNPWFIKPHCSIPVFIRDICSKQQINSVPSKFKQLRQVNFFFSFILVSVTRVENNLNTRYRRLTHVSGLPFKKL